MKRITNEISTSAKKSLVTRTVTAILIALFGIPCLVLGGWFFFFFSVVVALIAAFEIVRATNLKGLLRVLVYFITIVFTLGIIYYFFFSEILKPAFDLTGLFEKKDFLPTIFSEIKLSIMFITIMLCVYFLISFSVESFNVAYVFYFVTMILVLAIGIQSFLFLRFSPYFYFNQAYANSGTYAGHIINSPEFLYGQSSFLVIYVILGVIFNDMGAYFIGMLFGKHKMNERISPKKTWEGFIGGVVFSIIVSVVFALICALKDKPLLPVFDTTHFFHIIIISIIIPLISDVGDFVFSSIKRTFGVKDFSNLLPGHGGILDRIDSLIFASALVSCMIMIILSMYGYGPNV